MNKKLLAVAVGATLAAATNAYALEGKLSGQINRAMMWVDDGRQSELHHVDNVNTGTRFRFTGTDEIKPGVKAGINFEVEMLSNPSISVSQTAKTNTPSVAERVLEAYFQSDIGKITVGQGSGAADGFAEIDLSGTAYTAQYAGTVSFVGGGIAFRNAATGAAGPTIGTTISDQDFESRYDRLRYDSPKLGPASLAISTGNKTDTVNEAALRLDLGVAGGKLAAGIGYSAEKTGVAATGTQTTIGGSLSWLAASGLSLTAAYTKVEDEATGAAKQNDKFTYLKVGYQTGQHAVSVDYGMGKDFAATGDESKVFGLAWNYAVAKWADIYSLGKVHSLNRPGTNFEDITLLMVGTRVKF